MFLISTIIKTDSSSKKINSQKPSTWGCCAYRWAEWLNAWQVCLYGNVDSKDDKQHLPEHRYYVLQCLTAIFKPLFLSIPFFLNSKRLVLFLGLMFYQEKHLPWWCHKNVQDRNVARKNTFQLKKKKKKDKNVFVTLRGLFCLFVCFFNIQWYRQQQARNPQSKFSHHRMKLFLGGE